MIVRQSTARTLLIGPILDSTGAAKTDEVIGSIKVTKNGTVGAANASATLTHDHTGKYKLALTATDTDTVGVLEISLNSGTNDMPVVRMNVVEEAIFDRDYAASATGAVILQTGTGSGQLQIASGQVQIQAGTGSGQIDVASGQVKVQAGTGSGQLDVASGQVKIQPGTGTGQIDLVSGAVKLAAVTHTGAVIPTVSAVSGAVGSVTGSVGSVTAGVTVTTNNDKTGYSLSQTFPTNFSALSITAGGIVKADLDTIKTQAVTCAGGVTVPTGTLASTTNITAGTIATVSSVTAIATGGVTRASFAADTGLQSVRSGTAQAGAAGTITLDAGASATTDFYTHLKCYITGGTGAGQFRIGTAYNGTTKVLTITPNWTTTPDATSTFALRDAAANVTAISGAALSTTTAQLGVNVVNWGGTAVASAAVRANAIQFAGQTITCSGAVTVPGSSTLASTTNITAGTITTTTNLTNLPTIPANWLTAAGLAADAVTEIQSGLMLAASYTAPPSAADVADAVWDEATAGHVTAGTFALSLATVNDLSVIPGLVWDEVQAGHTTAGTFGYYLDSQVSTAGGGSLTAADVWTYGTRVLTAGTNIGTVDANLIQIGGSYLAGNGGTMAAAFDNFFDVGTPVLTTASVNQTGNCYPLVDTEIAAIKAKTDLIPASPAEVGSAMTLADGAITAAKIATDAITADKLASDAVTEIQSGLATAADLTTVAGYLDTEIADIKAKTDLIPADPAQAGDEMALTTAAVANILKTSIASIEDTSAEYSLAALILAVTNWEIDGTDLVIYKTDGTTEFLRKTLTNNPALTPVQKVQ